MERRREPRFLLNQPARVTVLRGARPVLEARILNVSGRGMRIALPSPVPVGAPLKIEIGDALILAEVAYTTQNAGSIQAGLKIDQVLSGLSELMRLHQSLLREQRAPSLPEANPDSDVILPLDAAT